MPMRLTHQVIHIVSGKGGVGKTTMTAGLGTLLALSDLRVLMIDADFGLRNLDLIFHLQERLVFDLGQVLEKQVTLEQALIPVPGLEGLSLLTSSLTKSFEDLHNPDIEGLITECRQRFDVILIDHGAGFGQDLQQFITHGDAALLVSQPQSASLRSVNKVLGELEKQMPCYWIINRWTSSAQSDRDMLKKIADVGFPVMATIGEMPKLEALYHNLAHPLLQALKPVVDQWSGCPMASPVDLEALLSFESRGLFPFLKRRRQPIE